MSRRLPSVDIVVLTSLVLGVAWSLAGVDFYSRGEGREALNALGALQGNWVLPRGYGGGIASKPPLLHWLIAAVSLPFGGVTASAARLPSFVAALAVCWGIFRFAPLSRRWVVILVLMSSFEWVRGAVSCRVDMLHAATLAGALMLWPSLRSTRTKRWRVVVAGSCLTAASVLTKGPVALVISAVIFSLWYWIEERHHGVLRGRFLKNVGRWLGSATIIAGLWYGVALVRGGDEFRQTFWSENVGRFTGTMDSIPHEHGVGYLTMALFAGLLPWSLIVPVLGFKRPQVRHDCWMFFASVRQGGIRAFWRGCSRGMIALRLGFSSLPAVDRYSVLVGAVIFIFYCIPGSKRGVYLLAGYPFYAMVLGRFLERLVATGSTVALQRVFAGGTLGLALLLLGCSLLGLVGGMLSVGDAPAWVVRASRLLAEMGVGSSYWLAWIALGSGLVCGLGGLRRLARGGMRSSAEFARLGEEPPELSVRQLTRARAGEDRSGILRCLTFAAASILMIQANIQAPISRYWSERPIAEKVREFVPADARLVSWHREFYGASLYVGRTIVPVNPVPADGDYCLLRATDLPALRTELPQPLQPVFVSQAVRGLGGSDTVLLVRIESPGVGLGSL